MKYIVISFSLYSVCDIKNRILQSCNSPILEFNVLRKSKRALYINPLFNGVLVHIYYFKKYFKPRSLILKGFWSTLNSRIGELEISILDVTIKALHSMATANFDKSV